MSDSARVSVEAGRDALTGLLADVPADRLAAVAEDLFAFLPLPAGFSWDDRRAVVDRIASLEPTSDGVPPLVAYVMRLATGRQGIEALGLSRWAGAAGRAAGLTEAALRRLYDESQPASRGGDTAPPGPASRYPAGNRPKTVKDSRSEDSPLPNQTAIADLPKASLDRSDAARIWGSVPLRNPDFTGREGLLLDLQRSLETRSKASVLPHTLHGFGGVGKTQLAVEFTYRFIDRYDLVWWVPAEQQSLVLQSLADLGRQLGIPVTQDFTQAASLVIEALGSTSLKWLVVYDNANDPDDLAHLIPSVGGHVILTSRNQAWSNVWDAIEVNVFDRAESIQLIQRRGTGIVQPDADRLAEKLGDLPLALDQAASWQTATGMPVNEYLDLFDQHHQVLLAEGKPTGYPTTIAALVKLAFQRLQRDFPAVAQLLEMFAILGAEPISIDLLRRGRRAGAISEPLGSALRDGIVLGRIVRDLRKFGLAKVDTKNRIQVHRLFQLVLRDELDAAQLQQSRKNVHELLGTANPGDPDNDENRSRYAEIAPHVLPSGLVHAESSEARRLVLDQIRYLYVIGDYEASRQLGDVAVKAWEKRTDQPDLGPDGELTLLAGRHLGAALLALGINDRSRTLYEDTFRRLRDSPNFGPDHEHTLYTAGGVAAVQRVSGEFELALRTDRENVERHQRVYGDEDSFTLQQRGNQAVNLRMLSDFPGAYEIDADVVRILEETLTKQDPPLLFAQSNLARDLYGLGRYAEALDLQERVLPTYRQVMSHPKHPYILLAARTRAIAMRKNGQYSDALRIARENYHDMTARYGDSHQHSLAATMTYANTLRSTGDLGEARGLALDAVTRYRRIFGERHPLTLVALVNTAVIQRGLGNLIEARQIDENAYATMVATLGAEHGYTLCAAIGLANDFAAAGETGAARQLSDETVTISRRSRGERHPYTLLCAVNAGFDRIAAGERENGQTELESGQTELATAIAALSDLLGPSHPECLDARRGKRAECDIEPPPT